VARTRLTLAGCAAILLIGACRSGTTPTGPPKTISTEPGAVVLIAAGDIACAPNAATTPVTCHQISTAAMLERSGLAAQADGAVLLGDIQYESGRTADFGSFRDSWGAALDSAGVPVLPTPGNHEWYDPDPAPSGCHLVDGTHNACGYETYFGARAFDGDVRDRLGNRGVTLAAGQPHPLLVLLVDAGRCEHAPSWCAPSSPAAGFVRRTLADRAINPPEACVVVGWHQARWSDHGHGDLGIIDGLWQALFSPAAAQRPDLVLNGHDHVYERMPALGREGQPNPDGIPEVIVGTGGREVAGIPYAGPGLDRAAFVDAAHFGALALEADPQRGSIATTFVTESGDQLDRTALDCRT
jgi:calcineurin-like phosphoesterase family protein